MKAYESVAGVDPRRLTEQEAHSLSYLQESLLRAVVRIASVASPPPANQVRENLGTGGSEQVSPEVFATRVKTVMEELMSDPSSIQTIQEQIQAIQALEADLGGVATSSVPDALDDVGAAKRHYLAAAVGMSLSEFFAEVESKGGREGG